MKKKRKWLSIAVKVIGIFATFSSLSGFAVQYYNQCLPSKISVTSGQEETLSFRLPVKGTIRHKLDQEAEMVINLSEPITLVADELTTYDLELELFGFFALKDVELEIVPEKQLIPAGIPIGIYLETKGVLIVDVEEVDGMNGKLSPAKYILQKGDYVLAVDGETIEKKVELISYIQNSEGKSLTFTIRRNNQVFDAKATPILDRNGKYQLGIWIKDNAQGIGTLTYIDELGSFGALGHGIHETTTGEVVYIDLGSLYDTEIISIKKGENGAPGELTGVIEYNKRHLLGDIYLNTDCGIFGNCNLRLMSELEDIEPVSIGYKQQVTTGPAQIVCSVNGKRAAYDIEITAVHYEGNVKNKRLEIHVTDPELIALTGGIVQGMSGASILQNDKIIGAVTHVLVRDSTRGYGIFIEDMLEAGT